MADINYFIVPNQKPFSLTMILNFFTPFDQSFWPFFTVMFLKYTSFFFFGQKKITFLSTKNTFITSSKCSIIFTLCTLVFVMWMWCDLSIWWVDNLEKKSKLKEKQKEEIRFRYQSRFGEEDNRQWRSPIVHSHRSDGDEFVWIGWWK